MSLEVQEGLLVEGRGGDVENVLLVKQGPSGRVVSDLGVQLLACIVGFSKSHAVFGLATATGLATAMVDFRRMYTPAGHIVVIL